MTVVINGSTGLSGVAGSASTPALVGSDADSGYYINSANEPNASVNGTAVWNAASTFGFKNRIINGAMMIDQRNAGASVTPTDGQYTIDRWRAGASAASKFSVQQSSVAPAGFNFSMLCTSLSAYSVGTNDNFEMFQLIEGFNTADLGWGTANAQAVTLSFWVRSSLTGTFGGSIQNSAFNRSYPFSYTISVANTWEQKSVTIAGDTSGTWIGATNGTGIVLCIGLGAGSGRSGTAGSWAGATYYNATGATSVVGTNGATFYITGVQLEKGSTATSFDYRPYGTELALCQRYYYNFNPSPFVDYAFPILNNNASSYRVKIVYFPVFMRAAPTISSISVGGTVTSQPGSYSGGVCGAYFQWNSVSTTDFTGLIGFNASAEL